MNKSEHFQAEVIAIIKNYVGKDIAPRVTLDSYLHQDLGLTSFDYMQLFDQLEQEVGDEFDFELMMKANTVRNIVEALIANNSTSEHYFSE
jgi:acyl carrier protein